MWAPGKTREVHGDAPLSCWPSALRKPHTDSVKTMCERELRSLAAVAPTARCRAACCSSAATQAGSLQSTASRWDTVVQPVLSLWDTVCFLPAHDSPPLGTSRLRPNRAHLRLCSGLL